MKERLISEHMNASFMIFICLGTTCLSLPVSLFQDIDDVQVHYPGITEVMTDLQGTNYLKYATPSSRTSKLLMCRTEGPTIAVGI